VTAPWFSRLRRSEAFVVFSMLVGGGLPGLALYVLWPSVWSGVIWGVLFWPCVFVSGAIALPPKPEDSQEPS
jgi:hypothetical protein